MGLAWVTCSTAKPGSGVCIPRTLWVCNGNKGLKGGRGRGTDVGRPLANKQSLQADNEKHEFDFGGCDAFHNWHLAILRHRERDYSVIAPPQVT